MAALILFYLNYTCPFLYGNIFMSRFQTERTCNLVTASQVAWLNIFTCKNSFIFPPCLKFHFRILGICLIFSFSSIPYARETR